MVIVLSTRMNKEKRHLQETQTKQSEDLGVAEEKLEHLNKVKKSLTSND